MKKGYYVMGKYTSVAWFLLMSDAISYVNRVNSLYGGINYRVVPVAPDSWGYR